MELKMRDKPVMPSRRSSRIAQTISASLQKSTFTKRRLSKPVLVKPVEEGKNVFNKLLEQYGNEESPQREEESKEKLIDVQVKAAHKTYSAARRKSSKANLKLGKPRNGKENTKILGSAIPHQYSPSDSSKSQKCERTDEFSENELTAVPSRAPRKKPTRKETKKETEFMHHKNLEFEMIENFPLCVE